MAPIQPENGSDDKIFMHHAMVAAFGVYIASIQIA
jgi:hypothetical protein